MVITGDMGLRAVNLFLEAGINIVTGAYGESSETLVKSYLNSTLHTGANLYDRDRSHHQCNSNSGSWYLFVVKVGSPSQIRDQRSAFAFFHKRRFPMSQHLKMRKPSEIAFWEIRILLLP